MGLFEELTTGDWLKRNSTNFTHQRTDLRMGWEQTLKTGDAISKFILNIRDEHRLSDYQKMVYTKLIVSKVVDAMNIKHENIGIGFTKEFINEARADKSMTLSIEPLANNKDFPTFNHKVDVIAGFGVHEMGHLLYSDYDFTKFMKKGDSDGVNLLKHTLVNILEDERIETTIGEAFPGFSNYIAKEKEYVYDTKVANDYARNLAKGEVSDIENLMNTLIMLVRYPSGLREDNVHKFEKEIKEMVDVMNPFPITFDDVIECSDKLYDIVKKYYEEQQPPKKQQQQKQQSSSSSSETEEDKDEGDGSNTSSKSSSKGDGGASDEDDDADDDSADNNSGSSDSSDDNDSSDSDNKTSGKNGGSPDDKGDEDKSGSSSKGDNDGAEEEDKKQGSSGGSEDAEEEKDVDDALNEALKKMLTKIQELDNTQFGEAGSNGDQTGKTGVAKGVLQAVSNMSDEDVDSLRDQTYVIHPTRELDSSSITTKLVKQDTQTRNSYKYDEAVKNVGSLASSLRAKIKEFNRNQTDTYRGLFEGTFDEDALIEARVGAKNVYKTNATIRNNGATVVLLIDESGSMMSHIGQARDIAVLFERALLDVNKIDFYCYGHSTIDIPNTTEATMLNVYYEGRAKGKAKCLGNINYHDYNRDGHAILQTVGRVRQFTKQPIVLFMISDGEPSASVPRGYSPITYTKKCVEEVEKKFNTQVIHIAITSGIPSKSMFTQFVTFTNMSSLVRDIGSLLTKVIKKLQMPATTYE